MNNKSQLQKEIKERVKLGVKPSDLKKKKKNIEDEGYESDNSLSRNKKNLVSEEIIQQLEQERNFEAQKAQNYLTEITKLTAELDQKELEIKELRKTKPTKTQTELEKALIEANQKIRDQAKTISDLDHLLKTGKNSEIIKGLQENIKVLENENKQLVEKYAKLENRKENKEKDKETNKLFTCFTCQKTFSYKLIRLVDKNNKKVCRDCLLKMLNRANQETGEEIVLRKKKKEESNETSQPPTFICQTCQQNYQGQPHQVHISNYQEQGIIPQQLTSICSNCLQDKVVIADLYCPRTSEGRDTWNPNEPQFDCYCPTNK